MIKIFFEGELDDTLTLHQFKRFVEHILGVDFSAFTIDDAIVEFNRRSTSYRAERVK